MSNPAHLAFYHIIISQSSRLSRFLDLSKVPYWARKREAEVNDSGFAIQHAIRAYGI